MAVDIFVAYVGVYPSVEAAEADYQLGRSVPPMHRRPTQVASSRVHGCRAAVGRR